MTMPLSMKTAYILLILIVCLPCAQAAGEALPLNRTGVKVIASWDAVPNQEFDSFMKLGVVAFHEAGADVRFSVNGGTPVVVTEPSQNDQTGVWEYWIPLDARDYPDGPVTVTARAYPAHNPGDTEARDLPTLTLIANSKGTLTRTPVWADCSAGSDATGDGSEAAPYQTLEKAYTMAGSGGTVYLKAGTCYAITNTLPAKNYDRWTTVTAAPGLSRNQVKVRGGGSNSGRFAENMVKWQNLEIFKDDPVTGSYATIMYFEPSHRLWFDNVEIYNVNGSHWAGVDTFNAQGARYYMTGSVIRNVSNAGGYWQRNCTIRNIGADVWRPSDGSFYVNIDVDNMDYAPGAHPDLIQFYNPGTRVDNVILYNVYATNMMSQGLFGDTAQNVAFVNLMLEKVADKDGTNYMLSQLADFNHLLIWHSTFRNLGVFLRDDADHFPNSDIENNVFTTLLPDGNPAPVELPSATVRHNHYRERVWTQTNGPLGTGYTEGDPLFVSEAPVSGPYHDPSAYDYHLTPASPAYKTGVPMECVPADIRGIPYNPVNPSPGAFANGEETDLVPLPGMTSPPTDPDGDGIYEDLNANGRKDFNDVVLFFEKLDWIAANEPVAAFDPNGNGRADFDDIVRIYDEL
jgi:PKD repeat protein